MCRANVISCVVVVIAVLIPASPAHSQICEPSPDGFGCSPAACGAIPEDRCLETILRLDVATGAITTEACACQDFNFCHVVAGNASFFADGYCPTGEHCELVSTDTNNDGVFDRFTSACIPDPEGLCCLDIDDGPIAFDTCIPSGPMDCMSSGGIFHSVGPTCDQTQACCLGPISPTGASFCADINLACCMDSGGVPLGSGSTCANSTTLSGACPQTCGGIAGIQCDLPDQFCMLPPGGCCCDFMGVCTTPPAACPTVWDPVCGCNGQTYGNACEAAMAGMSIDHPGVCEDGACCLPDGLCVNLPIDVCLDNQGVPLPPGVPCDVVFCGGVPTGACCLPNAAGTILCEVTTETRCADLSGAYQGDNTTCPADLTTPCGVPTGACCLPIPGTLDPICEQVTEYECLLGGGAYQGDGTNCVVAGTGICPSPIGACCLIDPTAGSEFCFEGSRFECANAGGDFLGEGTHCPSDPNLACSTISSACCFDDGTCTNVPFETCVVNGGHPGPLGSQCGPHHCPSPPTGACCLPNVAGSVSCEVTTETSCADLGGTYQGDNTFCPTDTTTPCVAPTGACCRLIAGALNPSCEETTEVICDENGGSYLGDGTTCPADGTNPCPPPTGACCTTDPATNTAGCFVATEQECVNEFGSYLGDGTECPPDANLPCAQPLGACCFIPTGAVVSTCAEMSLEICVAIGGRYLGDGSTCPDDPALDCPTPCPALCGVFECVEGCGTIVQGVECLLFESAFGTFVLSDLGPFGLGDRVHVTGCVDPFCTTICMQGDGCIQNFEISACGEVCGGIAGTPCSSANEFCKFPTGTCGDGDVQGICTPIPNIVCPEIIDPVCGCDGVTYVNECEAAAASMSIAHLGACDTGPCAATRSLGEPDLTYCSGMLKPVHIALNVPAGTTVIAVEDTPPPGWQVVAISDNGNFDAANGKVKWGPFFAPFPQVLNYVVLPAAVDNGPKCFTGVISIDGINRDTCGDQCVDKFCHPFMAADVPQPPCPNCPLSDCNGCDQGSCQDGRISLCEVISYTCSWKTGCNDDLSGMTRAAFIWKNGECYCLDEVGQNWFPTPCTSPSSGLCSDVGSRGATLEPIAITKMTGATATIRFRVQNNGRRGSVLLARIAILIHSPASTSAAALDFHIPSAWTVVNVGNDGEWDEANRKVKWGPYFEDTSRTVFVTARKTLREVKLADRTVTTENRLSGFYGTVSFDGVNQPVIVPVIVPRVEP